MDNREARKEYKLQKSPKGVFAVRCQATSEVWVDGSTHLDTQVNRIWLELRAGSHRNKPMQAAWNAHGEQSFAYEILETVDAGTPALLLRDLLAERRIHWARAVAR